MDRTPRELTFGRLLVSWLPAALWAGLIFYLSSQSEVAAPGPVDRLPGWTYLAHWSEYFMLGALLYRGALLSWGDRGATNRPAQAVQCDSSPMDGMPPSTMYLAAVAIGALFAATDEWHQAYVPGRTADPSDWLADLAGALLGALAVAAWQFRRDRKGP